MGKIYNHSTWKPRDAGKIEQIFSLLAQQDMGFNDLQHHLKWSKLTLTVYLTDLAKKECIKRERKGKCVINSLVRNNPYVAKILRWDRVPSYDLRIMKRTVLDELDEEDFMAEWINSLEFSLLNIIQDFVLVGEKGEDYPLISLGNKQDVKDVKHFLKAYLQDMVDTVTFYGDVLAKRVRLGTLKPDKVWQARNKLLEQIKLKIEKTGLKS